MAFIVRILILSKFLEFLFGDDWANSMMGAGRGENHVYLHPFLDNVFPGAASLV
jgi:hypothetical protein